MEDHRTDRLSVLLDQFDWAREIAQARLEGLASPASLPDGAPMPPRKGDGPLTDEEYLWEPAPGAWSIRRRGEAASPRPFGPGEWTFGERRRPPAELVDFSPSAAVALERFWATLDRWRDSVAGVTAEQLDTVGFDQYPRSSAPEEPFINVIAAANVELIHHMAEIALLRDLYRTRPTGAR